MRLRLNIFLFIFVSINCVSTESHYSPDGKLINTIKCPSKNRCFKKATEICNGTYQVLDNYSKGGTALGDWDSGNMVWYIMDIRCGSSDGIEPTFPFRGRPISSKIENFGPNPDPMDAMKFRLPTDTPKKIDYNCVDRCTDRGDSSQFCRSKCSY